VAKLSDAERIAKTEALAAQYYREMGEFQMRISQIVAAAERAMAAVEGPAFKKVLGEKLLKGAERQKDVKAVLSTLARERDNAKRQIVSSSEAILNRWVQFGLVLSDGNPVGGAIGLVGKYTHSESRSIRQLRDEGLNAVERVFEARRQTVIAAAQ
jgi:hypothetical protein